MPNGDPVPAVTPVSPEPPASRPACACLPLWKACFAGCPLAPGRPRQAAGIPLGCPPCCSAVLLPGCFQLLPAASAGIQRLSAASSGCPAVPGPASALLPRCLRAASALLPYRFRASVRVGRLAAGAGSSLVGGRGCRPRRWVRQIRQVRRLHSVARDFKSAARLRINKWPAGLCNLLDPHPPFVRPCVSNPLRP